MGLLSNCLGILRLGNFSHKFISDEMITYVFEHWYKLFNLDTWNHSSVFFDGVFLQKILDLGELATNSENDKLEEAKSKGQQYITKTLDELELNYFHLQGQFTKTMAGRKMSDLDSIIFIYNIQASHWATIAILPKYKKIELFDSIGKTN